MSERPEPDVDQVREALRQHDERTQEDAEEPDVERDDDEDEGRSEE